MTQKQIIVEILISLACSLVAGAVLQPSLKALWEWMNRPRPLSPSEKRSLIASIDMQEEALERLNYYSQSSKDLFLYLFQLVTMALLFFMAAVCVYALWPTIYAGTFAIVACLISLSAVMCIVAYAEANRMSDKNIDAHKERIRKNIEEAKGKLKIAPYNHDP